MAHLTRSEEALLALGSMPRGQATPVRAIKMLFLMEKRAPEAVGGAKFNFVPYDYGPFDQGVYTELNALAREGYVDLIEGRPRIYSLTERGRAMVATISSRIEPRFVEYFKSLGSWIDSLTFGQLVSAIYKQFPEMRVNSIFRG